MREEINNFSRCCPSISGRRFVQDPVVRVGIIDAGMKKFVLILVLVLLPLQASWGVVSMYVAQEHDACLHPYSESQEVNAEQGDECGSTTVSVHHKDHFCGLHALSIVETYPPRLTPFSFSIAPQVDEPRLIRQTLIERPERPKWAASA